VETISHKPVSLNYTPSTPGEAVERSRSARRKALKRSRARWTLNPISYSRPFGKPGRGLVSSTNYLLVAPVFVCTKLVRGVCTGTCFYQPCLDQSEVALKAGPVMHRTIPERISNRNA